MFVLDNLLLAPGKALFFVFQEMLRKAQEDWMDDDSIKKDLQDLYAVLDAGRIDEHEFESRESLLLQRLEQIARFKLNQNWSDVDVPQLMPGLNTGASVIDAEMSDRTMSTETDPVVEGGGTITRDNGTADAESSFGIGILQALRPLLERAGTNAPAALDHEKESSSLYTVMAEAAIGPLPQPKAEPLSPLVSEPAFTSSPLRPQGRGGSSPNVADNLEPASNHPRRPMAESAVPHADSRANESEHEPEPRNSAVEVAQPPAVPARRVAMNEVVENAIRSLSLTRLKLSSVTLVGKTDSGWKVGVELIERASVPDTNDLLGVYEVELDDAGIVTRYERTRVRRRSDLSRT